MPTLASIEYCTGCTACASACPKGCISMTADENGFLRPVVDVERCISCHLCEKSCPIITPLKTVGHTPKAYAAYSKDEAMRLSSSSGGIFTELAKAVLRQGGAVYGATYNEQFNVVHICVENEKELAKLRGAKYAQSDLCGVFAQIKQRLDGAQKVLFTGTPCQVGGLKAFLHKTYENLLTIDFVCHGVPSPMVWHEYVKYRAEQDNDGDLPTAINLRSKESGWSRYAYSCLFEYLNGTAYAEKSNDSQFMKLFVGDYINRQSCSSCKFKGFERCSDITLGDFWGIWDVSPDMDDNMGTSVVLIQSNRGAKLFEQIKDHCVRKSVSLEDAGVQNGSMLNSSPANFSRGKVLASARVGDFERCAEFLDNSDDGICKKIIKKLYANFKNKLNTL